MKTVQFQVQGVLTQAVLLQLSGTNTDNTLGTLLQNSSYYTCTHFSEYAPHFKSSSYQPQEQTQTSLKGRPRHAAPITQCIFHSKKVEKGIFFENRRYTGNRATVGPQNRCQTNLEFQIKIPNLRSGTRLRPIIPSIDASEATPYWPDYGILTTRTNQYSLQKDSANGIAAIEGGCSARHSYISNIIGRPCVQYIQGYKMQGHLYMRFVSLCFSVCKNT